MSFENHRVLKWSISHNLSAQSDSVCSVCWARVNERDRAWSSVVERVERGVAAASVVRAWYERGYLGTARARIRVFERGDIV